MSTTDARSDLRRSPVVQPSRGTLRPLGHGEVTITGGFLGWLQRRNGEASFAHVESWLERSGWLANFDAAAEGRLPQDRRGREFSDSEVYKFLEALAWEFGRTGHQEIDHHFVSIARRVAAAQEQDGYLNTRFGRPGQEPRYSDLEWGHELYCYGHLIQAGVARARTVGVEDDFVRLVVRVADHVCETFGPNGIQSVCGHPVIEPALVELYRVTGERRYLDQARLFVDRRGYQVLDDVEFGRDYFQDDVPVAAATVLRGHAVRALYLSAGATDLAVETQDERLLRALRLQWHNTVNARTYLTGGMGSRHQDEAYGPDFVLPPDRAYSETCAGVASIMFSWRLLLADGESKYADLIERTIYNVLAASPSSDGRRFFYTNTLHQRELGTEPDPDEIVERAASSLRAPWFSVSCCPTNLARTFASLAGYVASTDVTGLQLHQFAPATIRTTLADGRPVALAVQADYPRSGRVSVRVMSPSVGAWTLSLRVPSWAEGATISVNGVVQAAAAGGYARVFRDFREDDLIQLELPMTPRVTSADPRVDAVRGCVAIERGPEVLCLESIDLPNGQPVDSVRLRGAPVIKEAGDKVTVSVEPLRVRQPRQSWPYQRQETPTADVSSTLGHHGERAVEATLRPYRTWGNRGPSTMRVWLPLAPG